MTDHLPSSADAARAILPGVRIAARERYGKVRMAFLAPFLPILIQILAHFLMKWLESWMNRQDAGAPTSFATLARAWEADRPHEVRVAMERAAMGETGE